MSIKKRKRRVEYWDGKLRTKDNEMLVEKRKLIREKKWKGESRVPNTSLVLKLALLFSALFFVISSIIFFLSFVENNKSVVTPSKVLVDVTIQRIVDYGKNTPIDIKIVNTNPVPLQNVVVDIEYPEGVLKEDGVLNNRIDIIPAHSGSASLRDTIQIFRNTTVPTVIPVSISYSIPGSSSPFIVNEEVIVSVKNAPIDLSFTSPKTISQGVETEAVLVVRNVSDTAHTVFVELEYPAFFTFSSSLPSPIRGTNNTWIFSNMKPGSSRSISLSGLFSSSQDLLLAIRAQASIELFQDNNFFNAAQTTTAFALRPSFAVVDILFGRNITGDVIVNSDEMVRGTLQWRSLSSQTIQDLEITLHFSGNGFSVNSIRGGNDAFFDGNKSTLLWNGTIDERLVSVSPGASGSLSFSFQTLSTGIFGLEETNRAVHLGVTVRGKTESGKTESIHIPIVASAKLKTQITLVSETRYSSGSGKIQNTGPTPPQRGETTTYSLHYTIKNEGNTLEDVTLTIPLASRTQWRNTIAQSDERVTYDSEARSFVWHIGRIEGLGIGSSRTLEVQVAVNPESISLDNDINTLSLTQRGVLEGVDSFTKQALSQTVNHLTTRLPLNER